jgi:hypothetical protein
MVLVVHGHSSGTQPSSRSWCSGSDGARHDLQFKVKDGYGHAGDVWADIKFKARLNVRGDRQIKENINPFHKSRPTADIDSLLLATTAGTPGAEFLKIDVFGAFLNAQLDANAPPIWMHPPRGLDLGSDEMLRLTSNIYGLVEAAYLWFREFSGTL